MEMALSTQICVNPIIGIANKEFVYSLCSHIIFVEFNDNTVI